MKRSMLGLRRWPLQTRRRRLLCLPHVPNLFRLSLSKPARLSAAASEPQAAAEEEAVVFGAFTEASGVAGQQRLAVVGGQVGAEAQRG